MTVEQLKEGQSLHQQIESLRNQRVKWENGKSLLGTMRIYLASSHATDIDTSYINFDVLKALTLNTIDKYIDELETRLANL